MKKLILSFPLASSLFLLASAGCEWTAPSKAVEQRDRLYACKIRMEMTKNGKLVDMLVEYFNADGRFGEKGEIVVQRKFGKRDLKITAWAFNDHSLNFTYELSNWFSPFVVSWQTNAGTIQTREKDGKINKPKILEPIIIEDLNREFEEHQRVDTHLTCERTKDRK